MKKRMPAAVAVFLLLSALFCACRANPGAAQMATGEDAFAAAFRATGAQMEEMRLIAWSVKASRFMTVEEMKAEAKLVAGSLGLQGLKEKTEDEDGWRSYSLQGGNDLGTFNVLLQSLPDETYLLVSVAVKSDIEEFPALCRTLLAAAKGKKEADLKCLIVGSFPGKLGRGDLEERISCAFAAAGARSVEQAQGGNYFSRTGYVPSLPRHLLAGQNKVNLQMAGDYSENEQKTYLYLGSPLIFDDY